MPVLADLAKRVEQRAEHLVLLRTIRQAVTEALRAGVRMTGSALRLAVWSELSERHRQEICMQIRARCDAFISSLCLDRRQRRSEIDELVSEVIANLLRATSVHRDDQQLDHAFPRVAPKPAKQGQAMIGPTPMPPWVTAGAPDDQEPAHDARVKWIVEETCNRQALRHRYEDVRRRDRGGKWDGSGYPLVAVDDQTIERLSGPYDPTDEVAGRLDAEDSRLAWIGLVQLVTRQFGPHDDVVAFVKVLANDRDTQESFGSQWPVRKIVQALNSREPNPRWDDDRVENAKRRLTKCIVKLKQVHGLDAVDLRALLARFAREIHSTTVTVRARIEPLHRRGTDQTPDF